jgi:hypothetical protein
MPITSEEARAMAARRWSTEPQALDRAVAKIVRRAGALTPEQLDQLRSILPPVGAR